MTREEAIILFRNALISMSGLAGSAVLLAEGDNPRPSTPHVWMRLRNENAESYPDFIPGTPQISQTKRLRIEIEAVGYTIVPAFKAAIYRMRMIGDPVIWPLSQAGVSIRDVSEFMNVAAVLRTSPEPREMVNVTIGYQETANTSNFVPATAIDVEVDAGLASTVEKTFVIP